MYPIHAGTARFEEVEILGVPALFTTLRVDRNTIPKGMYAYDMQTDPEDWSQPCLLGQHITAEHFGTVLTASPIHLPENGYLDLSHGDLDGHHGGERMTAAEFEAKYLSPDYQPNQPQHTERKRRIASMTR